MYIEHQVNSALAIVILSITAFSAGFLVIHALKNASITYQGSDLLLTESYN